MSVRFFKAEAKKAQAQADAELDPVAKQILAERAAEIASYAELASLQNKLEKAIAAEAKKQRDRLKGEG